MKRKLIIVTIFMVLICLSLLACTHTHSFDKWQYDENVHWKECSDCGETVLYANHNFGSGDTCECGYKIPEHKHELSEGWTFDSKYHWHEALCGHADVVEKVEHNFVDNKCSICDYFSYTNGLKYEFVDGSYSVVGLDDVTVTDIVIPDTYKGKAVTSIGDRAFEYCDSIVSVTIPNSVTDIGKSVFHGCRNLVNVTLPDKITRINYEMFEGCSSLVSIDIPDNVISIDALAFMSAQA